MNNKRKSHSGLGRLTTLILILLVSAGVYVGFQVIPFYYYYNELLGQMDEQAKKASLFRDQQIRKTLLKFIDDLEIPIDDPDDLKINRFNNKIVIELEYNEVLYIDLGEDRVYDLHVFHFHPRVEQDL